ncbi:hypothetical protein C9I28_03230 [Pseudoduganella armeniaca]|uniref:Uncharacterized protein n=1 Tax=Pseudoduganella armeniaca TaxID=2072590 RepID=A0A2R4CHQ7_9BURK|nr:hypothetical protein C9I28_03230 [Pseudoduganella armeniaca]
MPQLWHSRHRKYCHECAEPAHAHPPSAGEFIHEFIGHYVALEGKLWRTVKLLVARPGELTRQYLSGRRVPYLEPLRLYLTLSLVFFALIKTLGIALPQLNIGEERIGFVYARSIDIKVGGKDSKADFKSSAAFVNDPGENNVTRAIDGTVALLGRIDATWRENIEHFHSLPAAERSARLNHGFAAICHTC